MRPPMSEYSPSLFSRTTRKSMSAALRSRNGDRTPCSSRHRPQVDVLPELAADGDEQAPQGDVIRVLRESPPRRGRWRRAREWPREPVLGHHPAGAGVDLAAPGKLVELEGDAVLRACRFQDPDPFGHHLPANPVTGDHRDAVARHRPVRRVMCAPARDAPAPRRPMGGCPGRGGAHGSTRASCVPPAAPPGAHAGRPPPPVGGRMSDAASGARCPGIG